MLNRCTLVLLSGFLLALASLPARAAEPHLANPVAICTDEKGRWYVAETFRLHKGVTDIRKIMSWLDDDLACKTVEDRLAMHRKHEGDKVEERAIYSERIKLLEDR